MPTLLGGLVPLMRVLALDLAQGRTGWATEHEENARVVLLGTGVLETPGYQRQAETRGLFLARQYVAFAAQLDTIVAEHAPLDLVSYEHPDRPHHAHWAGSRVTPGSEFNAMRAIALAEGWVTAWRAERHPELDLLAVTIAQAKKYVTGNPNASKELVNRMLRLRWHWEGLSDEVPVQHRDGRGSTEVRYDRSDACSVGLYALGAALSARKALAARGA